MLARSERPGPAGERDGGPTGGAEGRLPQGTAGDHPPHATAGGHQVRVGRGVRVWGGDGVCAD